jgi:hypothetical protein
LSSVLDDVLRLDKTLFTDGGVLIVDQICLVIPGPRQFPDGAMTQLRQLTKSLSTAKEQAQAGLVEYWQFLKAKFKIKQLGEFVLTE